MAKNRKLPILSVVPTGSSDVFPRFLISDARDGLWNGHDFGPTGVLYADHNHAATDVQAILKKNFEGVEPQRYVVPLCVEALSHEPVSMAQVAQYLSRVSRLFLNTTDHGNGPGSSLVLPRIEWHRMKQEAPHE